MKNYSSLLYLLCLISFLISSCTPEPIEIPCLNNLTYKLGDSVQNFPVKDHATVPNKTKLHFIKNLGTLDQDTLYRKAIKYHWDDSGKVNLVEYGIMNNGSSNDKYIALTDSIFLKYFECFPGFKTYLKADQSTTPHLKHGNINLRFLGDQELRKVIVMINE